MLGEELIGDDDNGLQTLLKLLAERELERTKCRRVRGRGRALKCQGIPYYSKEPSV